MIEQKLLKCHKCGYEGSKAEFRYLCQADGQGPDTYRRCPRCHAAVYCAELEVGEQFFGEGVWGAGPLRGRVFRKKNKKSKNVEEGRE